MIKVTVKDIHGGWDPRIEEFVDLKGQTITLEHSLISLHKWESKWKKPYLSKKEKTTDETIDYIRCMTLEKDVDPNLYNYIDEEDIQRIKEYIEDPMTATTFHNYDKGSYSNEIITAEVIYYLMIQYGIPMEFRKWHFNQLITLIRVCEIKSGGGRKMSEREILANNKALNAQRRAMAHSKG